MEGKFKVIFGEGAADDLTEEEKADIVALIEQKLADGVFFQEAQLIDFEALEKEDPEMYARLCDKIEAMPVEGESDIQFGYIDIDLDEPQKPKQTLH